MKLQKTGIKKIQPGDTAPNFQLPSVQGGLFRLEMRTVHGPVVLIFANLEEQRQGLLKTLGDRAEELHKAGAYNYAFPQSEIRAGRGTATRAGATPAIVVRAAALEPVRELQSELKLPFYVLWDDEGRVSSSYGIESGETAAAVVETSGKVAWVSESGTEPQVDDILKAIQPASAPD